MSGNDALGNKLKTATNAAFKTIVLTTDIVWAGADDNYINNNEKDATTLSGTVAEQVPYSLLRLNFLKAVIQQPQLSSLPTIANDKL
ncbi:MAG: hypothetical protein H0A76_05825 [Candidatus Thiodubiliella endoseptemdiera]|uniref:Uncharacterized protein n=1 Tax=Candidatus Thiodubiliella endoseptemdiera TaxID=2738886 RepID=A0A853F1Z7_9GAMM|nr:hypothetical protein [Candidatus Thiodubiliella endoseptemdiera]